MDSKRGEEALCNPYESKRLSAISPWRKPRGLMAHISPNSSKSRVIYLALGYEERVGEVFESQVTQLNTWKGARVQRMHARVRMGIGLACAGARGVRLEHAGVRLCSGTVHPRARHSPGMMELT
ncbi:hypothetical protein CRG98_042826 [Punica granatum]|uniref:Uncharacterized protein n=1 Tax=Punica granatum TaxID=22663 RepID=A0A2I0HZ38_PUNGR|nr:hypothetical protein CRG98_042826 [Punica granatum]